MKEETQFKLQAYLDGELSPAERNEIEALLRQDADARALLAELRQTTAAFSGYEAGIKLPESREFYWSKIQREIRRSPEATTRERPVWVTLLRRMLIPAGSFAVVAVAVLLSLPRTDDAGVPFTATTDAVAFTYQNYQTGTTLVWLDYSGENDIAGTAGNDKMGL
jgi:anti-sigma factor RsiW